MLLQRQGRFSEAAARYQAVLDAVPGQPDALHLMGTIAAETMEAEAAVELMQRALAGKPGDPLLRSHLAGALLDAGEPEAAERHARRALKLDPELAHATCVLARCKAALGQAEEAMRMLKGVVERGPEYPAALIALAELYADLGHAETAARTFRRAVDEGIKPVEALAGLARCRTFAGDAPELGEIEARLAAGGLPPHHRALLHHAAGKIAEDLGRYDAAFAHFAAARAGRGLAFDMAAHRRDYDALRQVFTPEFFAARRKFGSRSECPVFIVGMPRAGTTLTEQIIASHPDAAGAGELSEMRRIAGSLGYTRGNAAAFAERVARLTAKEVAALAERYLAALRRHSATALRVTDKMPHNFERLGLIALLFPRAKIIHCRRDALDTCVSCFTSGLKDSHSYTADLATLGAYYREYAALMDHWRSALPMPIFEADYEDLVAAPEAQSRRLVQAAGLPWSANCLTFYETARAVQTASRIQVRQPIYGTSRQRWRRYEKHIGPLRAALGGLAVEAAP